MAPPPQLFEPLQQKLTLARRSLVSLAQHQRTAMNRDFFDLLYADKDFCEAMGRAALAAGRLESELAAYLREKRVNVRAGATLGELIGALEKSNHLSENGVQVLRSIKQQRNYLTHSLFDLFSGRIEETVLPRTDLVPADVDVFTEKAVVLEENLRGLSRIVASKLAAIQADPTGPEARETRVLRP